jgi:arginase family enzyme
MFHKTTAFFVPFDLFGSAGTSAGVHALADAFQEMLADSRREPVSNRSRAYARRVKMEQVAYETVQSYHTWRKTGRAAVRRVLGAGEFLIWITGNHLGALPVYDELARLPEKTLVVQLDAHLDVYNLSDCQSELSHGNYLLHCSGRLPPIINVGSRELVLDRRHVKRYFQQVIAASDLAVDEEGCMGQLRKAAEAALRVFIDLDCDALDPAYFPATPNPLPFGLRPAQLLRVFDAVWSDRVIGLAISEFDPARDNQDRCLSTLLWLLEYLLLKGYEPAES